MKYLLTTALIATLALAGCRSTQEALQIGSAAESNPGPCPRAFALYDASRIVEFMGDVERFEAVGFTAEIDKVRSLCRYVGAEPIVADMDVTMTVGRGPAAASDAATYELFVAVTRKNIDVIEKTVIPVTVRFPAGTDRITVTERVDEIVIPRANEGTSGENFEILTGFVITDKQREFNAAGKRFRVSAGADN